MCGIFGSVSQYEYEVAAAIQYFAFELALLRHCDPDKPRNPAKSVAVK